MDVCVEVLCCWSDAKKSVAACQWTLLTICYDLRGPPRSTWWRFRQVQQCINQCEWVVQFARWRRRAEAEKSHVVVVDRSLHVSRVVRAADAAALVSSSQHGALLV